MLQMISHKKFFLEFIDCRHLIILTIFFKNIWSSHFYKNGYLNYKYLLEHLVELDSVSIRLSIRLTQLVNLSSIIYISQDSVLSHKIK